MANGGNSTVKWVVGCGLGCLVIAIAGGAIVIGGSIFMARKGLDIAAQQASTELKAQYERFKAENAVPPDSVALYDNLVAISQHQDATLWTVTMVMGAVLTPLQDKTITEEERAAAQKVHDFLASNPDCSMMEMSQFVEANPELTGYMQQVSHYQTGMPIPAPAPIPTPEAPPEVPETP